MAAAIRYQLQKIRHEGLKKINQVSSMVNRHSSTNMKGDGKSAFIYKHERRLHGVAMLVPRTEEIEVPTSIG
jgi:hypothetical protein